MADLHPLQVEIRTSESRYYRFPNGTVIKFDKPHETDRFQGITVPIFGRDGQIVGHVPR